MKRKSFQKYIAVILCFCFMLPSFTSAYAITGSPNLTVNGVLLLENGTVTGNDVTGVSYDATTNVLTLDNYTGGSIIAADMESAFSILLIGNNTITTDSLASCIDVGFTNSMLAFSLASVDPTNVASLTLIGGTEVTLRATNADNLLIENVNLTITPTVGSDSSPTRGIHSTSGSITINDSTVNVNPTTLADGMLAENDIIVNDGSRINMPSGNETRLEHGMIAGGALEIIFSRATIATKSGCFVAGETSFATATLNNSTVIADCIIGHTFFSANVLNIFGGTTELFTAEDGMAAIRSPETPGIGNTLTVTEGSTKASASTAASLTWVDNQSMKYIELAGPLINRNSAGGSLTVDGTALMTGGSVINGGITGTAVYTASGNTLTLTGYTGTSIEAINMGTNFTIVLNGENTLTNNAADGSAIRVISNSQNLGVGSELTIIGGTGSSLTAIGSAAAFSGDIKPVITDELVVTEGATSEASAINSNGLTWTNEESLCYVKLEHSAVPVIVGTLTVDGTTLIDNGAETGNVLEGVAYSITNNSLTLDGIGDQWESAVTIVADNMGTLKVNVTGENYIRYINISNGSLTFLGSGQLYASDIEGQYGISVAGTLTVSGPEISTNGCTYGADSNGVIAESIIVTGGSLTAYGSNGGIIANTTPSGERYAEGDGQYYSEDVVALTNTATSEETRFVSKPCARIAADGIPRLLIGGIYNEITDTTTGYTEVDVTADASGAGWTYTSATNTLALNSYTGGGIVAEYMGSNFIITLSGDSVIPENGKTPDRLTWNKSCVIIRNTPLTTISGSGSFRTESTFTVVEGSLTVTDHVTLELGCGDGEGWYTAQSYDGLALWSNYEFLIGYVSDFEPTLTVSGSANITAVGYYNGVYINTASKDHGHLVLSGGSLSGSGDGVNMGIQVEGDISVSGGLLIGRGVIKDDYEYNSGYGILATQGITVTGGTVLANGYNYGIYLQDYDPVTGVSSAAPLTVSGTGCVIAEGRSILGGGVSAPAIYSDPNAEAGFEYDHVNVNGLSVIGAFGDGECIIGGFSITPCDYPDGSILPEYTRCGEAMTVTVTVTPASGKRLKPDSLKYQDTEGGGNVTVIAKTNGTYSFVMPDRAITITAEFVDAIPTAIVLTPASDAPVYNGATTAFTGSSSVTYNEGADTLTGAAVSYLYSTSENGEYGDLRPTNAGNYFVKGVFAGDDIYAASVSLPMMFTISQATPGLLLSNKTTTYTRNAVTVNTPTVSGISAEDVPTGQLSVLYYTSYTDDQLLTLTTPANSGAASDGAAPVKTGTYYAVATLTADGNYAAASVKATVKINVKTIASNMVSAIADSLTYNGQEQTPMPAIHHTQSLSSAELTPCSVADAGHIHGEGCNGDYYLTYENNTNAYLIVDGVPVIGSVTVHGTGNYTGTVTKSFIIQPYNITTNDAIFSVTGGWITDGVNATGPVTVTFQGVNGERPTATATGTVSSVAGGDYSTVDLSNVAITDVLHDQNYYYSDTYNSVNTGVNIHVLVISVTITWGEMEFTYDKGTWNTETHEWENSCWVPDNTDNNKITVENIGTAAVNVSFSYTKSNDDVEGSFKDSSGNPITIPVALPVGEEKYAWLTLAGKPTENLNGATLGTVTVTLGGE